MKPNFTFHYEDQPEFKTIETRAYIANNLRAYRRHETTYTLERIGLHCYRVTLNYPDATAAILQAEMPASPSFVDVGTITEYGLTQKLSNQIRVF